MGCDVQLFQQQKIWCAILRYSSEVSLLSASTVISSLRVKYHNKLPKITLLFITVKLNDFKQ
jgi:hypothetical protein